MRIEEMILVGIDDHMVEPPDMFGKKPNEAAGNGAV